MAVSTGNSNRGRPPIKADLLAEIRGLLTDAKDPKEPKDVVEIMKGRVSQTKVYEIARALNFAPNHSTVAGPDAGGATPH